MECKKCKSVDLHTEEKGTQTGLCNNIYCYWHYRGQCCPEIEQGLDNATPNQLDCPESLRSDFEEQMFKLLDEIKEKLNMRTFEQLNAIRKFMLTQEEDY